VRREVNNLGDVAPGAELDDEVEVGDVALDQLRFDDSVAMAVLHGVEHDDLVAEGCRAPHLVRADVAGTTGDEDAHPIPSISRKNSIIRVSPSANAIFGCHPYVSLMRLMSGRRCAGSP